MASTSKVLLILCLVIAVLPPWASAARRAVKKGSPPAIQSLVKPKIYRKMIEDRDVMTHASLDEPKYSFYAAMLVHESASITKRILTDYPLYAKMIPYVERTEYSPETKTLRIEGGIWKFKLRSSVEFEERGDRWIHYRIVSGHFRGMSGDVFFEPYGDKGTLVYFNGEVTGPAVSNEWPPRLVIERGAEVVFGFTGGRMRSYIEKAREAENSKGVLNGNQVPKPRSRL